MYKKVKGFTLLEVMVVLAIIGILAGLVLFGISAAQRNARDTERKAGLQDLNAGAADLYTVSGRPVSGIVFSNSDEAAFVHFGSPPASRTACDNSTTCVVVPLDGAARPAPTGGVTTNDQTKYIFSNAPTDGYQLAACLEATDVPFDNSTSTSPVTTGCP